MIRNGLRYREAVELANALGYDITWQKRGGAWGMKVIIDEIKIKPMRALS